MQGFLQEVADRKANDPTKSSNPLDTWKDVFNSDPKFRSPAIQKFLKESGTDVRAHVLGIDRNIPQELDDVARARVRAEHPDWQPNSPQFEGEATRISGDLYSTTLPTSTQQQKDQQARNLYNAHDALAKGVRDVRARLAGTQDNAEQQSLGSQATELQGRLNAIDSYITRLGVQRPTAAAKPTTTDLRTEMVGLQARRDGTGPALTTAEQQRLTALEGQFPAKGGRTATSAAWRPLTGDQETTVNKTVKQIQDDLTASGALPNDKSGTDANGTPKAPGSSYAVRFTDSCGKRYQSCPR